MELSPLTVFSEPSDSISSMVAVAESLEDFRVILSFVTVAIILVFPAFSWVFE